MDFKIDFKTLLTISVIVASLGGFYYTTQLRLDSLEDSVTELRELRGEVNAVKKELLKISRKLRKLNE
tara:strand:- start:122 stop:325 length:204 start_codon:yes stop_codon:yes gene_type:complete